MRIYLQGLGFEGGGGGGGGGVKDDLGLILMGKNAENPVMWIRSAM